MAKCKMDAAPVIDDASVEETRILIVDDHALVRNGIRSMIENEPNLTVCGEAEDEATAISEFRRLKPSLVVLDVTLGAGSGLEVVKQIIAHEPCARVIVLSMHDERIYGERALKAGAMAFVCKQDPAETILVAIRQVLSGELYFSQRLTQRLLRNASGNGGSEQLTPVDLLSDRELEAFELTGAGLTTREIAVQMHISSKTADRYRENLKKKLNFASANELIHYATLWVEQNRPPHL